jgi:hypothetical protein
VVDAVEGEVEGDADAVVGEVAGGRALVLSREDEGGYRGLAY